MAEPIPVDFNPFETATPPPSLPVNEGATEPVPVDFNPFADEAPSPSTGEPVPVDFNPFKDDEITMESLDSNTNWLKNSRVIYKHEQGEDFKGTDKELGSWLRNRHSKFAHDLTNLGLTAADTGSMSDEVKKAWVDSLETWDETDPTVGSIMNAVYHTISDPITIATGLATFGTGLLPRMFGGRGAALAAKFAFKGQLKKALLKQKVPEEIAEQIVKKKGRAGAVDEAILKEAHREAAKNLAINRAGQGALSGAAWSASDDVLMQSFMSDVDENIDDIDYMQTAVAALTGGVAGAALLGLPSLGASKLGRKKYLRQNKIAADEAKELLPETQIEMLRTIGPAEAGRFAQEAQKDLIEDGVLTINIGEGKNFTKTKLKDINREFANEGFSELEKVKNGVYQTKKITTSEPLRPADRPGGRTWLEEIIGKVKRGIYSNPVEGTTKEITGEIATARRAVDSVQTAMQRNIATRKKRFDNALRKDYGTKNLHEIGPDDVSLMDKAFRGDGNAAEALRAAGKTSVLKEISHVPDPKDATDMGGMRQGIQDLQDRLIATGKIKKGSELRAKIVASKDGSPELYVTRSFEVFDNPNWNKTVSTKVKDDAEQWLVGNAKNNSKEFGKVYQKVKRGKGTPPEEILNETELKLYNAYMGPNGTIQNTITKLIEVNGEDALHTAFASPSLSKTAPLKILKHRQDIPEPIRKLLGEYEDPYTNYAKTVMRLAQTVEQAKYEQLIADLGSKGLIKGVSKEHLPDMKLLESQFGKQQSLVDPLAKTPVLEDMKSPLTGMYAYDEIADAIFNGNEFSNRLIGSRAVRFYLSSQAHARASKVVYSATALARNFLGAGWMAVGAGYMRPGAIKEMTHVARGLGSYGNEALNKEIEKGMALGFLQSGTDIGSFRGALKDAADPSFFDLSKPEMISKAGLVKKAKQLNTSAVKLYQSMDDVWKTFGFINEKKNYRQVLLDRGIDPDKAIESKSFLTGDGLKVEITNLDVEAANQVAKHMQNYAGVPQFVRKARLFPAADYLAFTTEMLRTQTNIVKTALRDIKEGSALMKTDEPARTALKYVIDANGNKVLNPKSKVIPGQLAGQAQRKSGVIRLGSIIAAQSAAPALAYASARIMGMDEPVIDKDTKQVLPYTKREAIRTFDKHWEKGANFLYLGEEKDGTVRRTNISYLNPWANWQDAVRAGIRALTTDSDVDGTIDNVVKDSIWQPLTEVFGLSMVAEGVVNILSNQNSYGNKLWEDDDKLGKKLWAGVGAMWQAYEPGIFQQIGNIKESYNLGYDKERRREVIPRKYLPEMLADWGSYDTAVGTTPSGREREAGDQWMALVGVRPETFDIKDVLGFKVNDIKRSMADAGKVFKRAYQQRTPTTTTELTDAYSEAMEREYKKAKEMYDLFTKAKSLGLSNEQIFRTVTDDGLFSNRLDRKMLINLVRKGRFIPAPPKFVDMEKWAISTERRTKARPPIKEAFKDIMKIYRQFHGAKVGER